MKKRTKLTLSLLSLASVALLASCGSSAAKKLKLNSSLRRKKR